MAGILDYPRRSKRGEPVWELARLYPSQGYWSEHSYLNLDTNLLIEYHDGLLEFLPMPSIEHQRIVQALLLLLQAWSEEKGGEVLMAPMPLHTADKKYREPDLAYVSDPADLRAKDRSLDSAELVIEVVSEGSENRKRDYEEKREEYAGAGIPEYWIVDPEEKLITVLSLREGKYIEHCKAKLGQQAESALLKGFSVDVSKVLSGK